MERSFVTLDAPAKINLFLDVLSRRPDGFHNIRSIMQTVSLYDTVSVSLAPATGTGVTLRCTDSSLPAGENNIAYRAAKKILDKVAGNFFVEIEIVKRIPVAAGLAGGSADSAAVLIGINQLLGHPLSCSELCAVGASLGADVPFCIVKGTKITQGKGELITDCPPLPDTRILIAAAGEPVSTPTAYGILDKIYHNFSADAANHTGYAAILKALASGNLAAVCPALYNIFEAAILPTHSTVEKIKTILQESGAAGTLMSGSGPSVFALFDAEDKLQKAAEMLEREGIPSHPCRPVSQ